MQQEPESSIDKKSKPVPNHKAKKFKAQHDPPPNFYLPLEKEKFCTISRSQRLREKYVCFFQ